MQGSNLSWLEVEARYRIAERTALSRPPRRPRRQPAAWCPPPATPRRVIGHALVALGERLAQPRPARQRSAA